jgi:hypothetical protein
MFSPGLFKGTKGMEESRHTQKEQAGALMHQISHHQSYKKK